MCASAQTTSPPIGDKQRQMEFKDYYAALGVAPNASADEIKRSYRKLARKHHPDLNKAPEAEARFKAVAEAYKALNDPDRRAAYDGIVARRAQAARQSEGFDASGFEFAGRDASAGEDTDFSAFLDALLRRQSPTRSAAIDHHARIEIDLIDSYRGATKQISLRVPVADAHGRTTLIDRQLEIHVPKGIRAGQQLRLIGQGGADHEGAAGDLYLEIAFRTSAQFRLDGRDVHADLKLAPWEAALGATVTAAMPDGEVQLAIPPGSAAGRKLRLKGKGLPGDPAGDFYAVLSLGLPPADSPQAKAAYAAFASSFANFDPRRVGTP